MAAETSLAMAAADHPMVRITRVASRYLIFDIDDVMFLRRHHNLCSVFSGTVPQNPQQNVFMGLPVELMAEEARALVEDGAAYVVEDADFHLRLVTELTKRASLAAKKSEVDVAVHDREDFGKQRDEYLMDITQKGTAVMQAHLDEKQALREASLLKASTGKKNKKGKRAGGDVAGQPSQTSQTDEPAVPSKPAEDDGDEGLFGPPEPVAPPALRKAQKDTPAPSIPYAVTPTTTGPLLGRTAGPPAPGTQECSLMVDVPPSYPLFKHLHDKGYYMMPGLRFGCDYNVYPGDPLRFHAHFQATSYGWDEEINMMDLTAGGRLGTGVKKGWLVGGAGPAVADEEAPQTQEKPKHAARAFCLEWAGM
ncbi:uncharacterized protein B0I36DRAFT_95436 [Microdochium trichocladiopsis]|uniref:tRNA-splicing endonuclease subunit Sen34 n=1 Tax=Microdochium trichocladiopsis TaxID=1682393 RepID=A0A9P9BT80_9PEZI|nr:uncharacterized protein B0I36DRAFT_95436 [Microdochium trichocladiopsis]KAH7035670.1 hypothetical protein B0I36DRAFT_95436 [Microdochium trichocladiopsis]